MVNIPQSAAPVQDIDYTNPEIREKITEGFYSMCYLCEEVTHHYEIDHFYPKTKFPNLLNDWDNLFYCCNNCNQIKGSIVNKTPKKEILNNRINDVESLIILRYDELKDEVSISTDNIDPDLMDKINETIKLLNKIYNGIKTKNNYHKPLRKLIKDELEVFKELLLKYDKSLARGKVIFEKQLAKRLTKKSTKTESSFVSFKRRIILDNPQWLHFQIHFDQ